MTLPDQTIVETPPADTASSAPVVTPAKPAVQPGEDYEKRFKGLQVSYEKLKSDKDKLEQEKLSLLGDTETFRQTEKARADQLAKLQADLDAIKAEREAMTTQLESHKVQVSRSKLIMSEFPDLSVFEAQGLLPSAQTEEEMRTVFQKFKETFTKAVGDGVASKIVGAAPGATVSSTAPTLSKDQIYNELTRLAGSRPGSPERRRYDELAEMWEELNKPI